MRGVLPLLLIGLGIYLLRGYIFKPKAADDGWPDVSVRTAFRQFCP